MCLCLGDIYVLMLWCPSIPIKYLNICAPVRWASHLFAFPEHQVHEATDECHREADPGQDIGGTVRAFLKTCSVKALILSRVDGRCNHHT